MHDGERRVIAALWSLQGVGCKTIARLRERFGDLSSLLREPVRRWASEIEWTPRAQATLAQVETLEPHADALTSNLKKLGHEAVFPGDSGWPPLLRCIDRCPPILFRWGETNQLRPARRVAVVGSRHPETGVTTRVTSLCRELGHVGIATVSGAAEGVDQSAHFGSLEAGVETWAYLGSALDRMESAQRKLIRPFFDGRGVFYSEFPPGTRASRTTFPRRNRLISASADATLIVRAGESSGALFW